jgi:hypothetical protein
VSNAADTQGAGSRLGRSARRPRSHGFRHSSSAPLTPCDVIAGFHRHLTCPRPHRAGRALRLGRELRPHKKCGHCQDNSYHDAADCNSDRGSTGNRLSGSGTLLGAPRSPRCYRAPIWARPRAANFISHPSAGRVAADLDLTLFVINPNDRVTDFVGILDHYFVRHLIPGGRHSRPRGPVVAFASRRPKLAIKGAHV